VLQLASHEDGVLHAASWDRGVASLQRDVAHFHGLNARLCRGRTPDVLAAALEAYADGDLAALDRIAIALAGTPFQRRVWEALRGIPPGSTLSYAALARRIGHPAAIRAVGHANGSNPVPR